MPVPMLNYFPTSLQASNNSKVRKIGVNNRHCDAPDPASAARGQAPQRGVTGLLRRFAPRNDGR
jgi:hypothetical protein